MPINGNGKQLSNNIIAALIGVIGTLIVASVLWLSSSINTGDTYMKEHFNQLLLEHRDRDTLIQTTLTNAISEIQKNDQYMIQLIRALQQEQAVIKRNQEIRLERERKGR